MSSEVEKHHDHRTIEWARATLSELEQRVGSGIREFSEIPTFSNLKHSAEDTTKTEIELIKESKFDSLIESISTSISDLAERLSNLYSGLASHLSSPHSTIWSEIGASDSTDKDSLVKHLAKVAVTQEHEYEKYVPVLFDNPRLIFEDIAHLYIQLSRSITHFNHLHDEKAIILVTTRYHTRIESLLNLLEVITKFVKEAIEKNSGLVDILLKTAITRAKSNDKTQLTDSISKQLDFLFWSFKQSEIINRMASGLRSVRF